MEAHDLSLTSKDADAARAVLAAIADQDARALVAAANGTVRDPPGAVATEDRNAGEGSAETAPEVAPDVVYRDVSDLTPLRLRFPFVIGGLEVSTVTILPPTFGDVEAMMAGRISELEMHARMCSLPVAALRAMRWPDTETVTLFARHFAPEIQQR